MPSKMKLTLAVLVMPDSTRSVSPDGDYEFKGDSWNEMSFSGEVLKKDDTTAKEYGDGRPTITT